MLIAAMEFPSPWALSYSPETASNNNIAITLQLWLPQVIGNNTIPILRYFRCLWFSRFDSENGIIMDTYPFIMKRNILCLIPGKGDFWIKFVVFLVYV